MLALDDLLTQRPMWDLDDFTEAANDLLRNYLPRSMSDSRVTETVNPRLVRHYASEGMIDGATREGRKALYSVDHLLQLLALRRLQADGISTSSIGDLLTRLDRESLRSIVEGRVGFDEVAYHDTESEDTASSPPPDDRRARAAAALAEIRARSQPSADVRAQRFSASRHGPPTASDPLPTTPDSPTHWERLPLLDGVELHVRSDVRLPDSPAAQQKLLDHVIREIVLYAQRRNK